MKGAPLLSVVLSLMLVVLVGWLMSIGKSILLPITIALIAVYVSGAVTVNLARLPGLRLLPKPILRIGIMSGFVGLLFAAATVIAATVQQIISVAPGYESNLLGMLDRLSERLGRESDDVWQQVEAVTIDKIDLDGLLFALLGGFTSFGGVIFLVVLYAIFLMGERGVFERKVRAAFPNRDRSDAVLGLMRKINGNIGRYLAVKTLINVILGIISFLIMTVLGVDFALFWAIVIGLLNYIPYIGSYLGVAFPAVLSLGQFGDLPYSILILASLTAAQVFVGNILEPKLIGRQMNLSPFVVLVALAVWGSLWGVPGAILAVPMTSILAIILSEFDATRPIVVLMAERVDKEPDPEQQEEDADATGRDGQV